MTGEETEAIRFGDGSDPLSIAVTERDRGTLRMVQEALEQHRLALAFQPVVLAATPERVAFYEGQIRVLDETGRIIPARDFIGAVESRELGRRIDCAALQLGLDALAGEPGLRLAINMSARSMAYPGWMRVLDAGLARDPTIAERLILEVTEQSAMLLPDLAGVFMEALQQRGIAFALDDFGAGYTAFRHLRDFYFDIVKIDGQFIRGIAADPDNQVLARALLSIAGHFEMVAVAESVETVEDSEWLRQAGFDCLQGYFHGAPSVNPPWRQTQRRRA